jgi:Flp pilus assembly protein protease CpaA
MLALLVLFGMLGLATVTDLARHKIYNWTTYPAFVLGIVLSVAQSVIVTVSSSVELQTRWRNLIGAVSPMDCLYGLLACGLLLLVCVLLFAGQVGGGDVKLLTASGALLGFDRGLEMLLWTFVLAAAVGMIGLIWKVGPLRMAGFMRRMAFSWFTWRRGAFLTDDEKKMISPPLYLAPSALMAAIIVRFSLIQ